MEAPQRCAPDAPAVGVGHRIRPRSP